MSDGDVTSRYLAAGTKANDTVVALDTVCPGLLAGTP